MMTLDRAFYLPAAELNAVERREGDVVTYAWETNGKILAKGFAGKSNKPAFYHQYGTIERRTIALDKFFADCKATADRKAAAKAEKAAAKSLLNAGTDMPIDTILVRSWGYEQTNVDFYKVVGTFGKLGLKLVRVGTKSDTSRESGNSMADYCLPDLNLCGSEVKNARINDKNWAKLDGDLIQKWDGRPEYRSWYA
jgi:hypothetical protein